jgi:hypothetical protein
MIHGIHMDCSMWTGAWIPYGIVHGFAIKIHWKFHGIHMKSPGECKDLLLEQIYHAYPARRRVLGFC